MGLIRSRSKKQRNRAEAALLNQQARRLKAENDTAERAQRQEAAGDNPWRQATVGGLISVLAKRRRNNP